MEVLPLRHRDPGLAVFRGRYRFPPERHAVLQPPVEPRVRLQQRRVRSEEVFFSKPEFGVCAVSWMHLYRGRWRANKPKRVTFANTRQ